MDPVKSLLVPDRHVFSAGPHQLDGRLPGPLLAVLAAAYPTVALLNRLLSFLSWTNDDPYYNFVVSSCYALCVIYWPVVSHVLLPVIWCMLFCSFAWVAAATAASATDPDSNKPELVLDSIGNLTARAEFLTARLRSVSLGQRRRIILSALLFTPFQYVLVHDILGLRTYVLLAGLTLLTFHAPWAMATRAIVWRSAAVRRFAQTFTGIQMSLKDRPATAAASASTSTYYSFLGPQPVDYRIVSSSDDGTARVVEFEVFENERRWIGLGWSDRLLPLERQHYTNGHLEECIQDTLDDFQFPSSPIGDASTATTEAAAGCRWRWLDEHWKPDPELCTAANQGGWVYYDNRWEDPHDVDSLSRFTRTRRLTRRGLQVMNQKLAY